MGKEDVSSDYKTRQRIADEINEQWAKDRIDEAMKEIRSIRRAGMDKGNVRLDTLHAKIDEDLDYIVREEEPEQDLMRLLKEIARD